MAPVVSVLPRLESLIIDVLVAEDSDVELL